MQRNSGSRLVFAAAVLALAACRSEAQTAAPAPQSEEEKVLYALGFTMGGNLQLLKLSPQELEAVRKGLTDSATGAKAAFDMPTYGPKIRDLFDKRRTASLAADKEKAAAHLAEVAKQPGAVRTESGLVYFEEKKGTGASPKASDTVKVHYRGTLVDGTEFDSSYKRNEPAQFPLGNVIPCWTEGLQKMAPGGKAKLVCPSSIAYGDAGRPPVIPPAATLTFEVELLEVSPKAAEAPKPEATPKP